MRFVEQGADIPDELIRAVADGSATFLCGAGVSFRVNLPSFKVLTERVYERLGESPKDEAAERNAIASKEYDRALRSLEKRTHRPGTPSRVRDAVADALTAPSVAFPDHFALLQLSRDNDGRPRLLTTNFDTLFERAARAGGMANVPSYAGVSMPRAGGERDYGILHLHGRIADDTLGLERTDLILTSADFGDAYLRSGWASRYIEDRMRLGTLVLVGYGAEDAAMRLLLETLDADRDRFRDLGDIYAIEIGSAESMEGEGDQADRVCRLRRHLRYARGMGALCHAASRIPARSRWQHLGNSGRCWLMIENVKPKAPRKKTPADVTPFEREQLRFFLAEGDLAATLSDVNPSLAWLPMLSEMKLIQSETQLIAWIERNFADVDAVRDVVANIHFFGPETANFLEYRLNAQAANLPPLLARSWTLIVRHMHTAKRGLAQNEWFEIAPRLKRGDHSVAVLERLANALRPKLRIGKRFSWRDTAEDKAPERPSDLMSIDYKIEDSVSSDAVLAAWPNNATADTDESLLLHLTTALNSALADATDVGVENNEGYSASDTDVPSVARHRQNEYRSGFQSIIRVMAEIWTRLATKSPSMAVAVAKRWSDSSFRLMRRLAMFAFANPAVPGDVASDMLIGLPAGELFFTSSSVEIYHLIRARWSDFPTEQQQQILRRICEGPPRSVFREGAEIDRHIDRSRYDLLSDMVRDGVDIGSQAENLLSGIRRRWPQWQPKPIEQAGFHVWHESGFRELGGDADNFKGVPDGELVAKARKITAAAAFMEGDSWQGLCLSEPDRVLRGLEAAAMSGDWPKDYWEQLLWSRTAYADAGTEQKISELLLQWPADSFDAIAAAASSWLNDHAKTVSDTLFWPLWDRIADATLIETAETEDA